jgi:hypothetical protein
VGVKDIHTLPFVGFGEILSATSVDLTSAMPDLATRALTTATDNDALAEPFTIVIHQPLTIAVVQRETWLRSY